MTIASDTSRAAAPHVLPRVKAGPPSPPASTAAVPLACSLATSALLYLCHFPVAWGALGWVALVPLLGLVRSPARPRTVYWCAYLSGLAFYFPVIQWMRVADPRMYFTWITLSVYCSVYFPLAIYFVRKLGATRLPLVLTLPAVWVALEYVRANLAGGFPWYLLGYGQHRFLPLIQVADLAGPYAISFLVVAVNALAFEWLYRLPAVRRLLGRGGEEAPTRRAALAFQSAAVLAAFAACLAYGSWRMGQADFRPGPRIALIQGNVAQQIRNDQAGADKSKREKATRLMLDHYGTLAAYAAERKPDLIVWPETSWSDEWDEVPPEMARGRLPKSQVAARNKAAELGAAQLLGLNVKVWQQEGRSLRYNSALLLGRDGETLGRYDKIHRVPFGEYVPFREWLPWMNRFAPYDFEYSIAAGDNQDPLPLGDHRFGVVICYEDTDHRLAREYVNPARGAKADFVVNISNDGWFDGTSEHEEHLAICRFRAIECRRSVVRSVNMGISAVIDGNGRVLAPEVIDRREETRLWEVPAGAAAELPERRWGEFKKVPGVLFATVPVDDRTSLYARWGDWLPAACGAFLAAALLFVFVRRRVSDASQKR